MGTATATGLGNPGRGHGSENAPIHASEVKDWRLFPDGLLTPVLHGGDFGSLGGRVCRVARERETPSGSRKEIRGAPALVRERVVGWRDGPEPPGLTRMTVPPGPICIGGQRVWLAGGRSEDGAGHESAGRGPLRANRRGARPQAVHS